MTSNYLSRLYGQTVCPRGKICKSRRYLPRRASNRAVLASPPPPGRRRDVVRENGFRDLFALRVRRRVRRAETRRELPRPILFVFFRALLEEMGLSGVIQLASFHPLYQFAGEPPDSLGHFTNRAPYPLIHFLREDMVTQALETYPNPERIPERNIDTLTCMGRGEVERLMQALDD